MSALARSVLLLCRTAPYGSERARDALDIAMAFGAFEQQPALLFLGDGVLALLEQQNPAVLPARNLGKLIGTLADYGITGLHVDAHAMKQRGLELTDLIAGAQLADDAQLAALLAAHDMILSV